MSYYPPDQPGSYPPQQPGQSFPSQPLPPNAQPTQWNTQPPRYAPPPPPPKKRGRKAQAHVSQPNPGQFYQQPSNAFYAPPPPPPPPRRPSALGNAWRWFRRRNIFVKIGLVLVALIACGLCSNMLNAATSASHANQQATIGTTPTSGSTLQVHVTTTATKARPTPTPKPTQAPPTPTPIPPTPTPQPVVQATQPPAPTPTPCANPCNPWGYSFSSAGGSLLYSPNAGFCGVFSCVSTFWKDTNGYVVECNNGVYSHSGGVSGACSRDGGEGPPLYSH